MAVSAFRLLALFFFFAHVFSQTSDTSGCLASITLVERAGSWVESGVMHRIYDAHVMNTGSCAFSGDLPVSISVPAGSSIGYSWGFSNGNTVLSNLPSLSAQQTYSGLGFTFIGSGTPTAKINGACTCTAGGPGSEHGGGNPGNPTPTPVLPAATAFDRDLHFLVLTCSSGAVETDTLNVILTVLNSMGQSNDVIDKATYGDGDFKLTNDDGTGKYYAIAASTEPTCFNTLQQQTLKLYELNYKVRMVNLGALPTQAHGLEWSVSKTNDMTLTFADSMKKYARSMKTDAQVRLFSTWIPCPTIADPSIATPAFYASDATGKYIVSALITLDDGRQHLEFYFNTGGPKWSNFAMILGPTWLNWVSNGLFQGARRIEFNCHLDDMFMYTGEWENGDINDADSYRSSIQDLQNMIDWQDALVAKMPVGSTFVSTFPFNGYTINEPEYGGYDSDPLFLFMKQDKIRSNFYWESHTWDHPILDNYSYDACYAEWFDNVDTANHLFDNDLTNPNFNQHAVITPSISGLFNGPCLRAMYEQGIRYICGDNTHSEQLPKNDYHGWYTNQTSNGFDGMFVVPRWATSIYYDCSLVNCDIAQYNHMTNRTYTFDQLMADEVQTNSRWLLSFRHDPYMFHQANMRTQTIGTKEGTSLYRNWVDLVTDEVMKYTTLPFTSHRHEDLSLMLLDRMDRDACGFQARLRVDQKTNTIVGFTATSTATCKFAVSGAKSIPRTGVTFEQVGDEPTIWMDMKAGQTVTIAFTDPVQMWQ